MSENELGLWLAEGYAVTIWLAEGCHMAKGSLASECILGFCGAKYSILG